MPRRPVPLLAYTQFAIQDSGLFGPNPWKFIAQIVYAFPGSATQPMEYIILDSEFLLCELGVCVYYYYPIIQDDMERGIIRDDAERGRTRQQR